MKMSLWFIVLMAMARAPAQVASTGTEASLNSGAANSAAGLEGIVVQHTTKVPIKGVRIMLRNSAPGQSIFHNTVSDGDGRFQFREVKPGEYTLYAEKAGFLRQYYGSSKPLRIAPAFAG